MVSDVLIVYSPRLHKAFPNKRFLVSPNQLTKYVGIQNANKAILKAQNLKTNKCTLKFRSYGKLEIYLK